MQAEIHVDGLTVRVYETRGQMGAAAAQDIAQAIRAALQRQEECNIVFAAAPSQSETLACLAEQAQIQWNRVNAFHMDEYIGLPDAAPQRFGAFLQRAIFERVPFRAVHYLDGSAPAAQECSRYSGLLRRYPADIVVMGIGENGHIAFNDPHVADFADPSLVKVVTLDDMCRAQQVHDGCFAALEQVPQSALTLTIPALMAGRQVFCVVPASSKAGAVRRTLLEPVAESCPASILRRHPSAILYLDAHSAAKL